jgi:hypothetical protein
MKTGNEKDSLVLGAAFATTEMLGFRHASPSFRCALLNNHIGGFWYRLKSNLTPHGSNVSAVSSGISLAFLAIFPWFDTTGYDYNLSCPCIRHFPVYMCDDRSPIKSLFFFESCLVWWRTCIETWATPRGCGERPYASLRSMGSATWLIFDATSGN